MYIMESSISYVNKLYDNLSFFELHFQSILVVLLVSTVVIMIASASKIMSKSNVLKRDWEAERCKPNIMPFAGIINKPVGQTIAEYTLTNFNYCINKVLSSRFEMAATPFNLSGVNASMLSGVGSVDLSFNTSYNMFGDIQGNVAKSFNDIKNKFANSMVPVQQSLFAVQDMFYRMQAVLVSGVYTSLGNSLILKSLIAQMLDSVSKIFYLLLVIITALFVIPGTQGLAVASTAIALPLLVTTAAINISMGKALGVVPGKLPSIRKCFDKHTLIKVISGEYKEIQHLEVGDQLFNNTSSIPIMVTSTIVLDSKNVRMYNINGIIVSGFHKMKYEGNWIPISKYPYRREVFDYAEPYIYCINTTNKIIKVNEIELLDWDELYDEHLDKVLRHRGVRTTDNIHYVLDGGFCGDSQIKLEDKTSVRICDIVPGDKLLDGSLVYGVVKINSDDICEYSLGQSKRQTFKGGPNLLFYDSSNKLHTTMNKLDLLKNPAHRMVRLPRINTTLYHLLTDSQSFYVGNIKFSDYNSLIDTILTNIIC